MRVSKQQAAANRERILDAAAILIRERGIQAVGVDALAEAAGLTHGSLYSQFGSKDNLAAEALRVALVENAERFTDTDDLKRYVARYLSAENRDTPGRGCALAALACEMPRSSRAIRGEFTTGVRKLVGRLSRLITEGTARRREDEALATAAAMVGALILSRAVDDPLLADRILSASRKSIKASAAMR
jgi:TetR/AcrR family transcriptional repressor of nem operon